MDSQEARPPGSFHYENSDDWGVWVLDHGLPDLPSHLGAEDEVPIAYWAGPRHGVVLFKSWWSNLEEGEGHGLAQRDVNVDHYCYVRSKRGWESTGGGGGAAGPERDPLARLDIPPDFAVVGGGFVDGEIAGVTGLVGRLAVALELTSQVDGTVHQRIDAPTSWFVVCFEEAQSVNLRVLDANDQPLLERTILRGQL